MTRLTEASPTSRCRLITCHTARLGACTSAWWWWWWWWHWWWCSLATLHNVLFVQYLFLATERGGTWPHTSQSFNIFFSQLVRLRGKHFYERFCELQTRNLWFSLNYPPAATTGFRRFMPQSLSKYMGILLSPSVSYTGQYWTGSNSNCTNSTLCTGVIIMVKIAIDAISLCTTRISWHIWGEHVVDIFCWATIIKFNDYGITYMITMTTMMMIVRM